MSRPLSPCCAQEGNQPSRVIHVPPLYPYAWKGVHGGPAWKKLGQSPPPPRDICESPPNVKGFQVLSLVVRGLRFAGSKRTTSKQGRGGTLALGGASREGDTFLSRACRKPSPVLHSTSPFLQLRRFCGETWGGGGLP